MAVYDTSVEESVWDEVHMPGSALLKESIKSYKLDNGWMSVEVINYGATIISIKVPDKDGVKKDVALGYNSIQGYMYMDPNPYLGATIGRVANRIAGGSFEIGGIQYRLSKNDGDNTLHGGVSGFNKKLWTSKVDCEGVTMSVMSEHLDQGFPGTVKAQVKFVLTKDNELVVTMTATTDQATPVNMTNHSYFNLAGHDAGPGGLYSHRIKIHALNYTPVDDKLIPTGKIVEVFDTPFDLSVESDIESAIKKTKTDDGFDINYAVCGRGIHQVARVFHPLSGRAMDIKSNQPGVQFYTANYLKVGPTCAKDNATYVKHGALCLETQNFPNAVNQSNFPNSILEPGDVYEHKVSYKFFIHEPEEPKEEGEEGIDVAHVKH